MTGGALTLFGAFDLKDAAGQPVDLPGQKDRALLAFLALNPGIAHPRDKLAGLLWGDHGETQARDSLKHALGRLRQGLAALAPEPVEADRQSVRLAVPDLSVDVARFRALVGAGTPEALDEAAQLYAGDLLEGIGVKDSTFEDWLLAERRALRRQAEEAMTRLLAPAIPPALRERAAHRLLALDPLRETAVRTLMALQAARGERTQAIKLFEALRDRLHGELGVKPEADTIALHDEIRNAEPARAAVAPAQAAPPLPGKPSIAVLPFQNLSGDTEQEYFADGIVEEIITALSRMRWLFVIARNSSFVYKGRAVDVKQVGRELGVRYVLEGSVRRAASRVRIAGQLVDAVSSAHLWADRFDGGLEQVFDLQDQVAGSVAGAIAPKLQQAEIERAKRKPTDSLDAYDHYLRGLAGIRQWTKAASDEALRHFQRAIEIDPDYASAYGMVARCYSARKVNGWVEDAAFEAAESRRMARRVMQIGQDDPVALYTAGMALGYVVGDLEDGNAMIDRALALDPSAAWGWLFQAWTRNWLGEHEAAIASVEQAMRLSPQDPQFFNMRAASAWAHMIAGRHEEALRWARSALIEQPDYLNALCVQVVSSALIGKQEEAVAALRRLRMVDPGTSVARILDRYPLRRVEHIALLSEGLRKAGLKD